MPRGKCRCHQLISRVSTAASKYSRPNDLNYWPLTPYLSTFVIILLLSRLSTLVACFSVFFHFILSWYLQIYLLLPCCITVYAWFYGIYLLCFVCFFHLLFYVGLHCMVRLTLVYWRQLDLTYSLKTLASKQYPAVKNFRCMYFLLTRTPPTFLTDAADLSAVLVYDYSNVRIVFFSVRTCNMRIPSLLCTVPIGLPTIWH